METRRGLSKQYVHLKRLRFKGIHSISCGRNNAGFRGRITVTNAFFFPSKRKQFGMFETNPFLHLLIANLGRVYPRGIGEQTLLSLAELGRSVEVFWPVQGLTDESWYDGQMVNVAHNLLLSGPRVGTSMSFIHIWCCCRIGGHAVTHRVDSCGCLLSQLFVSAPDGVPDLAMIAASEEARPLC